MATEKKEITKKFYVVLRDVGEADKCPPQAKLIVETIKNAGGRVEREALLALLRRPVEEGGLKTNQTVERILGFYRPRLGDMKIMLEEAVKETIEVEVPDKPAPAPAQAPASAEVGDAPTAPVAPAAPAAPAAQKKGSKKAA